MSESPRSEERKATYFVIPVPRVRDAHLTRLLMLGERIDIRLEGPFADQPTAEQWVIDDRELRDHYCMYRLEGGRLERYEQLRKDRSGMLAVLREEEAA